MQELGTKVKVSQKVALCQVGHLERKSIREIVKEVPEEKYLLVCVRNSSEKLYICGTNEEGVRILEQLSVSGISKPLWWYHADKSEVHSFQRAKDLIIFPET